ncbi:DUF1127 domain-containing protein [bacterium]|nr:DUF1127 domain-containing protein [bacterium]
MFERIKALMERWQDVKEINALTDRDLDDLGMSRDQVQAFARLPHDVADRVKHMAAVFGLSDAELHRDHAAYLELLSTCGTCRERAHCAHVLADAARDLPVDASFCLNAEAFAAQTAA